MTRPRAFFYSQDAYGLGHVRRTVLLVGEIARRRPRAALLVASGSHKADELAAVAVLPTLDVLRLPEIGRASLYADLPADPALSTRSGIWSVRAAILAAAGSRFAPHLVHVDQSPVGYARELAAAIDGWRVAEPRPRLVLGLRDVPDEPWAPRAEWEREGAFALLEDAYDRILVYGDPRVYDTCEAYGFSSTVAAKTTFCGYLPPAPPIATREEVRALLGLRSEPLVVVTTGGGRDGGPLVRVALDALREPALAGVAAFVTSGPLLPPAAAAELAAIAARLPQVVLAPFVPDLVDRLAAADAVVTRGGGNALAEAVWLGKRPIVVPRVRPDLPTTEQLVRAERFAALGLATLLHPDGLSPRRLALAIRAELDAGVSAPPVLDFSGRERAGALLADDLAD